MQSWNKGKTKNNDSRVMAISITMSKYHFESREHKKKMYLKNPKRCKFCNNIINYEMRRNQFCSHSCAAKYNNHVRIISRKSSRKCSVCNKTIRSLDILITKCRSCGTEERIEKKMNDLELKLINGTWNGKDNKLLRMYIIYKRGYKCEKCKRIKWNNKLIPVDAHHIDGNYKNNHPSNLELLCKNCHAQTDTYGSKNNKNSKRLRLIRFRDKNL